MTSPAPTAAPAATTFDPAGKTFVQRVDAFISDVKIRYSIDVRKDSGRTAEWEQKLHVGTCFFTTSINQLNPPMWTRGKERFPLVISAIRQSCGRVSKGPTSSEP